MLEKKIFRETLCLGGFITDIAALCCLKKISSKTDLIIKKSFEKRAICFRVATTWSQQQHREAFVWLHHSWSSTCYSLKSDMQFHDVTSRGRALPKFPHGARWHQRWSVLVRVDAACATTRRFLSILWVEGKRSTEPIFACFWPCLPSTARRPTDFEALYSLQTERRWGRLWVKRGFNLMSLPVSCSTDMFLGWPKMSHCFEEFTEPGNDPMAGRHASDIIVEPFETTPQLSAFCTGQNFLRWRPAAVFKSAMTVRIV